MDIKELMIKLSDNKIYAVDMKNNGEIERINTKLYNIKRQQIERAKAYMCDDNAYKKYLTENLEYIKSRISLNITVKTTDEAIKLLQEKIDMRILFGIDNQYTDVFDSEVFLKEEYYEGIEMTENEAECAMSEVINSRDEFIKITYSIEENLALGMWIYRLSLYTAPLKGYIRFNNKTNKQLYFFKSKEDSNDYEYDLYYDVIELFEICMKCTNQHFAIKELCQLVNIKIEYEMKQYKKYESNLKLLNEDSLIQNKYPMLYDCLNYHGDFLKFMNIYGQEHINYSNINYFGERIFSVSNDFIGEKGTVNAKINLFCVLGLLKKIPFDELPKAYRHKTIGYKKEKNSYIIISYTDEVLNEAERRITIIKDAKVKPTKINGDTCRAIFGEELYNSVYGNYYKVGA